MRKYMSKMVTAFEKKYILNQKAPTPAKADLFKHNEQATKLDKETSKDFHTFTARGIFATKRGRLDIGTTISVLLTRVRKPNCRHVSENQTQTTGTN